MENKIKIEKNTVQETLIIPLYGRKMCSENFPKLYRDEFAARLCDKLDYDFSRLERQKKSFLFEFGSLEVAMRQIDMISEIKDYLRGHERAAIVNLGCGLDETGKACDNGLCSLVNVDFPDVIAIREKLVEKQEREINIACDLNDFSWMDSISPENGAVFFAAGVFYYFKRAEVKKLVLELGKRFKGGRLVFDSVGYMGLKLMMKKVVKNMDIDDISGYFYLNRPLQELNWSDSFKLSSRPYMLGYHDMKSPGVRFSHRLLAKIADKNMKMAVNRIDFE